MTSSLGSCRLAGVTGCALVLLLGAAACGGPQRTSDGDGAAVKPPPPPPDSRTPIERRRDAACDQLGPKLTACAVEDTRTRLAAGKIDQRTFDRDTAPAVQHKLTEEFEAKCKRPAYSSRQIRVLEVCFHEETECNALLDCLKHLDDQVGK